MFSQNTKLPENVPIIDTQTPINVKLSAMFKRSFAYFTVKERLPIIITKIIDQLSRDREEIIQLHGAKSDADVRLALSCLVRLRNEIMTNKPIAYLTSDANDVPLWNDLIKNHHHPTYFTAVWLFTECYVYRRIREAFEITEELKSFDPFRKQKDKQFMDSAEAMCCVADKLINTWLAVGRGAKISDDFNHLIKICLWSNKCDLSLSVGAEVAQKQNPVQFVQNWDDNIIINEFDNLYTYIRTASKAMHQFKEYTHKFEAELKREEEHGKHETEREAKKSQNSMSQSNVTSTQVHSTSLMGTLDDKEETPELRKPDRDIANATDTTGSAVDNQTIDTNGPINSEPKTVPVSSLEEGTSTFVGPASPEEPVKFGDSLPHVTIDIVCDNAGYELFTDLCLADFLLTKGFCSKVRFRLKAIPWFVSDVLLRDFEWTIRMCGEVRLSGAESSKVKLPSSNNVKSDNLNKLGERWTKYLKSGLFEPIADQFWTTPHDFSEMRRADPSLYRSLGDSVFVFFKGDLNYRKLVGENNWSPTTSFMRALQGFHPAPLCAIRTVKADLISGLREGQMETLMSLDEKWMETGDYGLIQTCDKVVRITTEELSIDSDDA